MKKLDPRLAAYEVRDLDDHPVALGSLWASGPAVLVFVRHFG